MTGPRLPLVLLAVGLPLAVGCQLAALWIPLPRGRGFLVKGAFGLALGCGLASFGYALWRFAGGTWAPAYLLAEPALFILALLVLAVILKKTRRPEFGHPSPDPAPGLLKAAAALTVLGSGWLFLQRVAMEPHGRWDAWAIWNLKARFLARGGADWNALFSPALDWTHPDYPLLLPATVARLWTFAGGDSALWPMLASAAFLAALLALLTGVLQAVRGGAAACLAAVGLLGTWGLADRAGSQYADLPLSLFMTTSLTCLVFHGLRPGRGLLLLAGFCAGCAGWTKNEGLMFALAMALAWLVLERVWVRPRIALAGLAWMGVGFLPALCAIAALKFRVPLGNDLLSSWTAPVILDRLAEPARYGLILKAFAWESLKLVMPAALLAAWGLAGFRNSAGHAAGARLCFMATGLMLAGYGVVYLLTPHDLAWHLSTSASRLLTGLWPAALMGLLLIVRLED